MQYVIAGKTSTIQDRIADGVDYMQNDSVVISIPSVFDRIKKDDTIVLLPGWWAKEWAKPAMADIMEKWPDINIIHAAGIFGEEAIKNLKSDKIESRFDILDL